MAETPTSVAIIGAGLAGTLLALSLRQTLPPLQITIYESRPPTAPELASGIVLTPNGLTILKKLHIYTRIKDICWTNAYRTYKNDQDETTRRVLVASEELHGFRNHRLYRRVLLRVIKDMCVQAGVQIRYSARFEGVVSDDASGVRFQVDGREEYAGLLVGADGIFSAVRRHVSSVVPEYTGTVGLLAHIPWSAVSWPSESFERQCTIQARPGAMFMIPETRDGSEVMVGTQLKHDNLSREEWDALSRDKDRLCAFWRRAYEEWHETGRKIIDAICTVGRESIYLWPFLRMPRLERWYSASGRVILVGDAAHAVPPSSGQGTNQALEDVWSLTLLLKQERRPRLEALAFWQGLRQKRVDAVFDWAVNATGVQRMPEEERRKLVEAGKVPAEGAFFDDMMWLYRWDGEERIQEWIDGEERVEGDR